MSLRLRLALALTGLIVVLVSLALLAYVLWPSATELEQFQPAPTLFAPPPTVLDDRGSG
jgi:hypothetical protein